MTDAYESQQNSGVDTPPELVAPLSVTDKFVGVLTEPTATFENVRLAGSRVTDYLVPMLALIVILMAGNFIRFSNPDFMAQIKDTQVAAMKEQVKNGAMTQEQADKAMESMEQYAGLTKIFGVIGVALGWPLMFFLVAAVYWLLAKFALKGDITYALVLSVYGLTAWIGVIDQLLAVILGYATNNMFASLSPTLFMAHDMEAIKSTSFRLLANLNPLTIWSYFVFSTGLHKVGSLSKAKAFGLVFGLWAVWILASSFIKIPGMG
jgi:hypothetical protein